MKIYRVESNFSFIHNKQSCFGPYDAKSSVRGKTEEIRKFMLINSIFSYSMPCVSLSDNPTPENDGLPKLFGKNFFFAFEKIADLKSWFNAYQLKKLSRAGFYVAIYETEDFKKGNKQVIFNKESSKLVDFIDLDQI